MESESLSNTPPALEDAFEDVIMKSQAALGIGQSDLAERLGCEIADLRALRRGEGSGALVRSLAGALGLDPDKLVQLRDVGYPPEPPMPPEWLALRHPFGEGVVNAYLRFDHSRKTALLLDTGMDAGQILAALDESGCQLEAIFLTHTHRDHIGGLAEIRARYPDVPVYARSAPPGESVSQIDSPEWKGVFGDVNVRSLALTGHSGDGTVFFVEGVEAADGSAAAIVSGDALFAGSIGGIRVPDPGLNLRETYRNALARLNTRVLCSFPPETPILPGHGPITNVARERERNPFFAALPAT